MATATDSTITISKIQRETLSLCVLGTRPLILNRMSEKARQTILLPAGRKNTAERAATLKHDPLAEFHASPYTFASEEAPTLLAMMASAFKSAMGTAALDLPGAKKAQIGRLVYVEGDYVAIYGTPALFMSVVRMADISHTPDIRTRVIVPRWAAKVEITFVKPNLRREALVNLLDAAGTTCGVGDWRPEKGKGSYGQFAVVNADDPEFQELLGQGRAVQIAAMADPQPYDQESDEMLNWWGSEARSRGFATSNNGQAASAPARA